MSSVSKSPFVKNRNGKISIQPLDYNIGSDGWEEDGLMSDNAQCYILNKMRITVSHNY